MQRRNSTTLLIKLQNFFTNTKPTKTMKIYFSLAALAMLATACQQQTSTPKMALENHGDTVAIMITSPTKYLLLPIQEDQPDVWVKLNTGNEAEDVWMDIRLARDYVDYYVPFKLGEGTTARVDVLHLPKEAMAWDNFQLSDSFDTTNHEYFRPKYHFSPA